MTALILILMLLFVLFCEELYRYIFCKNSSRLFERLFDSHGHEPAYYAYREAGKKTMQSLPQQVFTMDSARGAALKGFYYPLGSEGKTIAFVVHGYRSDHADTGGIACDYYESRGIDIFAPDHTAEGESEGHFIGFDVLEYRDCLRWIDFLREKFGPEVKIILHGFSMGAATVMQMSSHCPENVKFIVEDSGYENAYASMHHQIGPFYHVMRPVNRLVARYDWNDSDVKESLENSRLPMLFVHGRDDKLVPFCNGPKLYGLYPGEKDCFFPEKTRHIEAFYTCPEEYAGKLDAFIGKYLH